MVRYKNVAGVNIEMTPEEITDLEAAQKRGREAQEIAENARLKKEADRISGNQKLKDLGLTDDEITALTKT